MENGAAVSADILHLDAAVEADRITEGIRRIVFGAFKRKGAVVAVSGGIDISGLAFLCCRALGSDRVPILRVPEADSLPDHLRLGKAIVEAAGAPCSEEEITEILSAASCYEQRDDEIRLGASEDGSGHAS